MDCHFHSKIYEITKGNKNEWSIIFKHLQNEF